MVMLLIAICLAILTGLYFTHLLAKLLNYFDENLPNRPEPPPETIAERGDGEPNNKNQELPQIFTIEEEEELESIGTATRDSKESQDEKAGDEGKEDKIKERVLTHQEQANVQEKAEVPRKPEDTGSEDESKQSRLAKAKKKLLTYMSLRSSTDSDEQQLVNEDDSEDSDRWSGMNMTNTDPIRETRSSTEYARQTVKGVTTLAACEPTGKFILLMNTSRIQKEDISGWQIIRQVDNTRTIEFEFPANTVLQPNSSSKVWARGMGAQNPPDDFVNEEIDNWGTGENVQTILMDNNGEVRATHKKQDVK